jgi:hypothetical protein
VVDRDQQVAPHALDGRAQGRQLRAAFPVAREQDQTAHQRVRQTLAVHVGQRGAGDVDDERGVLRHVRRRSR